MKRKQTIQAFTEHAKRIVLDMQLDIYCGCSTTLATAHALTSLNNIKLTYTPTKHRLENERERVRVTQALQIAINFYEKPEIIAEVGADQAAAMVTDFMCLLRDENFN